MKTGIREKDATKGGKLYSKRRNIVACFSGVIEYKPKKVDRAKRMYRLMKYTTQDIV